MQSVLIGIPCLLVGGTEMQTLRLVEALSEGGYHVVVVCYFEYDFGLVQRFKQAGARVECLSAYSNRPETLKQQYKFIYRGLKRIVAEYRPKIAHIQYMAPGALPIFALRKLGVKNIIATLHTSADAYQNLRLVRFLQRHYVKAFTCVSMHAEQGFFGTSQLYQADQSLQKRNHFTLYNCLSPESEKTALPTPHPIPENAPCIGIVARLEHIKGADLILPAFAEVLQQKPDCRLLIVGDGKLREQMEQQQQELNIPETNITWAGRAPQEQLANHYRQMDLVWMPSRSEGFGLSAIEAMQQGLPIIASHTAGLSEIITNGVDGRLHPVGDSHALAYSTLDLLHNPAEALLLAQHALQRAQDFSFECYKECILNLYSKLHD